MWRPLNLNCFNYRTKLLGLEIPRDSRAMIYALDRVLMVQIQITILKCELLTWISRRCLSTKTVNFSKTKTHIGEIRSSCYWRRYLDIILSLLQIQCWYTCKGDDFIELDIIVFLHMYFNTITLIYHICWPSQASFRGLFLFCVLSSSSS